MRTVTKAVLGSFALLTILGVASRRLGDNASDTEIEMEENI